MSFKLPTIDQMLDDLDKAGYKTPEGMPSLRELHARVEKLCSPAAEMARQMHHFVDNGDGTFSIKRPGRYKQADATKLQD